MSTGDEVVLQRECDAIEIPSGAFLLLKSGGKGTIAQMLGGSFTLQLEDGRLVRVAGFDADALGQDIPVEARVAASTPGQEVDAARVWETMRTCYDPEIPVNIVDLGLIYDCKVEPYPEGGVSVKVVMTLTAPGCGMSDILKGDLETRIRQLPGVKAVEVEVAFDPPWDSSRMSDAARLQLGML